MEDKEDERLAVDPEKKVVGQGTCEGFSQKNVDKILQEFGDILILEIANLYINIIDP